MQKSSMQLHLTRTWVPLTTQKKRMEPCTFLDRSYWRYCCCSVLPLPLPLPLPLALPLPLLMESCCYLPLLLPPPLPPPLLLRLLEGSAATWFCPSLYSLPLHCASLFPHAFVLALFCLSACCRHHCCSFQLHATHMHPMLPLCLDSLHLQEQCPRPELINLSGSCLHGRANMNLVDRRHSNTNRSNAICASDNCMVNAEHEAAPGQYLPSLHQPTVRHPAGAMPLA